MKKIEFRVILSQKKYKNEKYQEIFFRPKLKNAKLCKK